MNCQSERRTSKRISLLTSPELVIGVALAYLIGTWLLFYLIDVRNILGLRDALVSTSTGLETPSVWFHIFREGGPTELLQWTMLGGTAFIASSIRERLTMQGKVQASLFWKIMCIAAVAMLIEDAGNPRHALASTARVLLPHLNSFAVRTVVELTYFSILASIPLYGIIRHGRFPFRVPKTCAFMATGVFCYAVAVLGSGSRYVFDLYATIGRWLHEAIAGGELLIGGLVPDRYTLEYLLMDNMVEESIELIGASFLLAAAISYSEAIKKNPSLASSTDDAPSSELESQ